MTDRTLPKSVITRARHAIAAIQLWNEAVLQARHMEVLAGCPGRYEYDLRADHLNPATSLLVKQGDAVHTLDLLEQSARSQGWSLGDFYRAVGAERPVPIEKGPKVDNWFQGSR